MNEELHVEPTSGELDELFERVTSWDRWGRGDERGALNHQTDAHRVAHLLVPREGSDPGDHRRPTGAPSPAHAEYAKRPAPQGYRPAQGGLDPHGRAPAPHKGLDDEHLEIPAFLRRQTN